MWSLKLSILSNSSATYCLLLLLSSSSLPLSSLLLLLLLFVLLFVSFFLHSFIRSTDRSFVRLPICLYRDFFCHLLIFAGFVIPSPVLHLEQKVAMPQYSVFPLSCSSEKRSRTIFFLFFFFSFLFCLKYMSAFFFSFPCPLNDLLSYCKAEKKTGMCGNGVCGLSNRRAK